MEGEGGDGGRGMDGRKRIWSWRGKVCKCKGMRRYGGIGVLVVGEMSEEGLDVGSVVSVYRSSSSVPVVRLCLSLTWVQCRIVVGLISSFFCKNGIVVPSL
jgi:ribosomal protein L15